jgi:hypothetical protein
MVNISELRIPYLDAKKNEIADELEKEKNHLGKYLNSSIDPKSCVYYNPVM